MFSLSGLLSASIRCCENGRQANEDLNVETTYRLLSLLGRPYPLVFLTAHIMSDFDYNPRGAVSPH